MGIISYKLVTPGQLCAAAHDKTIIGGFGIVNGFSASHHYSFN